MINGLKVIEITDGTELFNESICTAQRALDLMAQNGIICTMPGEIDKLVIVTGIICMVIGGLAVLGFQYMRNKTRKSDG